MWKKKHLIENENKINIINNIFCLPVVLWKFQFFHMFQKTYQRTKRNWLCKFHLFLAYSTPAIHLRQFFPLISMRKESERFKTNHSNYLMHINSLTPKHCSINGIIMRHIFDWIQSIRTRLFYDGEESHFFFSSIKLNLLEQTFKLYMRMKQFFFRSGGYT